MWSRRESALVYLDFIKMKFAVYSEMLRVGLLVVIGFLMDVASRLSKKREQMVTRIASAALPLQLAVVAVILPYEADALCILAGMMSAADMSAQNISRNALLFALLALVIALVVAEDGKMARRVLVAAMVIVGAALVVWYRGVDAGLLAIVLTMVGVSTVAVLSRRGFF
jgi:hypothetical protein